MNTLIDMTNWLEKDSNLTPIQEIRLFILNQLRPLNIRAKKVDDGYSAFDQDINSLDTIEREMAFIEAICGTLNYDDTIPSTLLVEISNKLNIIVDTYITVVGNDDELQEALKKLQVKIGIESRPSKIKSPSHKVVKIKNHEDKLATQKGRYGALENIVFSETGFSSLQAQKETLNKLQKTIQQSSINPSDMGRLQSDLHSLEYMYRNFNSCWENREELLRATIAADISKNADLAQRISMFIRVRSASKRSYTAKQEDSPILGRHMDNISIGHPIIVYTLEYGKLAISHIKKIDSEGAKGEYYKVRTHDKNGVKKDILLRTDNAVVGDLSRKYLGEFDTQGKLIRTNNTFTILSIHSNKTQYVKVESTLRQKIGETLVSIKNKVSSIFKR